MHQETKRGWCQFLTRNCPYIVKVEGNHILHQETKRDKLYNASRNKCVNKYKIMHTFFYTKRLWQRTCNHDRSQPCMQL